MSKRRGKRRGRSWWAAQVAAQARSGLSQRAFCEARGVSLSSFARWRKRLQVEDEPRELAVVEEPVRFVEVELPVQPAKPLVRVSLGAVTVDFETLPPPAWVAELVACEATRC